MDRLVSPVDGSSISYAWFTIILAMIHTYNETLLNSEKKLTLIFNPAHLNYKYIKFSNIQIWIANSREILLSEMYNGVGLQTARGSGTNGYVQTNMAFIRKSRLETKVKTDEDIRKMEAMLNRKPNQEILAHQARRKVEVKVLELREAMEEDGNYDEEEIEVSFIIFILLDFST